MRLEIFSVCLLSILIPIAHAARVPVDGIAAVVDGTPVLLSDVDEMREAMDAQQPAFSMLPVSQQRQQVLDRLIDEKVLIAKAKQDTTIRVNDKDVEPRADNWYDRVVEQQGGEKQLELALKQSTGMTLVQFKTRITDQMRDQMYRQRLQMKFVGDPEPSQLQVRNFFAKFKDSLPVQRNGVRLSHIQWRIKANAVIDADARNRTIELIKRLDQGESFSDLAKKYSEDFSGKDGGDLGYTKKGTLDPDFEKASYSLDVGDYSPHPVHTRFGYHIIRLTGRKDNEIRTSHILIKVIPSTGDTARALAYLDSVGKTLKTAKDFSTAAQSISEDRQTKELGGDLGWFQRDSLQSSYKEVVDSLSEGGISSPVRIGDSFHLLRVDRKVDERHLTLEEDYSVIAQYAKELIVTDKLSGLIKKWREHTPIENRLAQFKDPDEASPVDSSAGPSKN